MAEPAQLEGLPGATLVDGSSSRPGSASDGSALSWAFLGVLSAGGAAVPCLFAVRLSDAFVLPKLAALWSLVAACLVLVTLSQLVSSPTGAPIRWMPAVDIPVVAFCVLNLLAVTSSTDRRQSFFGERLQYQGFLTVLLYSSLFFLARHAVFDERRLTVLLGAVAGGAAVVGCYAILQFVGLDPLWEGALPDGRVFSTIGQPNAAAAYLVMTIPLFAYLLWTSSGHVRALLVLGTIVVVLALLLTQSRGGLVALLVTPSVLICLVRSKRRAALMLAGILLAASASALVVPPVRHGVQGAWDEFTSRGGRAGRLSIENHLDLWRVAARISLDHPLLGTGQETFPDVFPRYSRDVLSPDRVAYFDAYRVESAHNVFLNLAATTGIPTLVAYASLVVGLVLAALRRVRATADRRMRLGLLAVVAAVVGHVTSSLFMSSEITSAWLSWLLMGAAAGVLTRAPTDAAAEGHGDAAHYDGAPVDVVVRR